MTQQDLTTRIKLFFDEALHQPEDLHELQESLRAELATLKAQGLPQPADLVALEAKLAKKLAQPKE